MTDVLTPDQRRRVMSRIRGENTKPERLIRSALHARGFRFRLHRKDLPGKPDIVLPKYRAVIFVHGCFWHGHGCHLSKLPATRTAFWKEKIRTNQVRDQRTVEALLSSDWRVFVIWECSIRGTGRKGAATVCEEIIAELHGSASTFIEVAGLNEFYTNELVPDPEPD
jgi:DNA mismatch endonuclease (patch repair protein)